jgi:hypothetical protein
VLVVACNDSFNSLSLEGRALRSVTAQPRGWAVHDRVHVFFINAVPNRESTVVPRGPIDSTLSPKEGKWHQLRRRRLQPRRLLQRR